MPPRSLFVVRGSGPLGQRQDEAGGASATCCISTSLCAHSDDHLAAYHFSHDGITNRAMSTQTHPQVTSRPMHKRRPDGPDLYIYLPRPFPSLHALPIPKSPDDNSSHQKRTRSTRQAVLPLPSFFPNGFYICFLIRFLPLHSPSPKTFCSFSLQSYAPHPRARRTCLSSHHWTTATPVGEATSLFPLL